MSASLARSQGEAASAARIVRLDPPSHAARPASADLSEIDLRRWPRRLWLAQLATPVIYLAFILNSFSWSAIVHSVLLASMAVVAIAWIVAACAALRSVGLRNWLDTNRRQLALAVTTTCIGLVVADLSLTLTRCVPTINAVRRKALQYLPATTAVHRLVPRQRLRENHPEELPILINSRGYRGEEIASPKPEGTTRIVVLGGSQVFDYMGGNWPQLLQKELNTAGRRVEVINAGIPGHRTFDSLGKLLTDLWMLEPDVIVACEAWNDIKYFTALNPAVPYCDFAAPLKNDWRISPTGWDAVLCGSSFYRLARARIMEYVINSEGESEIMDKKEKRTAMAAAAKKRRKLAKTGVADEQWGLKQYELNIRALCETGRGIGARVVLCKQARMVVAGSETGKSALAHYGKLAYSYDETVAAFADCDRVVTRVAADLDCSVIDMHAPLSGRDELFLDQIHFSHAGSQAAAEVVAQGLRPLLAAEHDRVTQRD